MARETTVYVLDLNLGEEGLASAHEVLRLAVQRKVALFEKDEIGLVLAGTAGTDNPHYEALGEQYAHITVAHDVLPVKAVGITVLRALSIPPLAEARASDVDLFSALATAVHLLGTRIACRRKVAGETHSILLITAGTAELPAPDDEALDGLVEQCASNDIQITVLTLGIDVEAQLCAPHTPAKQATLEMLTALSGKMSGGEPSAAIAPAARLRVADLGRALAELREPTVPAPPASRSKYQGSLELTPALRLSVRVFPKVVEAKPAAASTFSLVAREREPLPGPTQPPAEPSADLGGEGEDDVDASPAQRVAQLKNPWPVKVEVSHAPEGDRAQNVRPEDTARAFKFGPDLVVEQSIAQSFAWKSGDKSLKLLGFVERDAIPQKDRFGGADVLIADPADAHAADALHALIVALSEAGKAMLVRFIPRKNAEPRTAACLPAIAQADDGAHVYSLFMIALPFSDEVRAHTWPTADAASVPTDEQLAAAAGLIDAMMLSADGAALPEGEQPFHFDPDEIGNPYLEQMRRVVLLRALTPGVPIPDVEPAVARVLWPHPRMADRARAQLEAFARSCPTEIAVPSEGGYKRTRQLAVRGDGDGDGDGEQGNAKRAATSGGDEAVPRGPVLLPGGAPLDRRWPNGRILDRTEPLRDLCAMLNDRSYDYTRSAFEQMAALVLELARAPLDDEWRERTLACMAKLRAEGIERGQPDAYNSLLHELRALRQLGATGGCSQLWDGLRAREKEYALISTSECEESEVGEGEALAFFTGVHEVRALVAASPPAAAGTFSLDDELE